MNAISQKILFVDDEVRLLDGIKRQLRKEFDITTAESGAAGLAIIEREGPFAVVVSDYNMPSMDGIQFLNQVYVRNEDTVLVMLTGRAELDIAVNALHNAHISRFLNKPCPKEILVETLLDGIEQYRLKRNEILLQHQLQASNAQLNELNTRLEDIVRQRTRALQTQYHYVAAIARMTSSEQLLAALMEAIFDLTGLDGITLYLSKQQDGRLQRYFPQATEATAEITPYEQGSIATWVLAGQQTVVRGQENWPQHFTEFDRSLFIGEPFACLPMNAEQAPIGLLTISAEPGFKLDPGVVRSLTTVVSVATTALLGRWHQEARNEAQDAIITALAKLSEYRDPETGAHLLRLKKYCALICRVLAQTEKYAGIVTPQFTEDLVRSSPLHDIGKVGIPDAILKKPGKLTEEEFQIMKNHAAIGGDTLRSVYDNYPSQTFIKSGMEVAYAHHEKWNGSGYPLGLQGDRIPLVARILALVDVYDALTARRVYKPPFPREQAKTMIEEGSGSHFDPDIVAAFLSSEAQFHAIAEQYADHF